LDSFVGVENCSTFEPEGNFSKKARKVMPPGPLIPADSLHFHASYFWGIFLMIFN
jgi:hypothetical protein